MKTLFTNSKVWLKENKFADSIGFDSGTGKINFTGSNNEADKLKSDYDEVIDLNKKLVLPSFTDGHCHFVEGSLVNSQLDLRNAETFKEIEEGIRNYRVKNKGKWIYGGYFSDSNFKEKITLGRKILDEICADVPVIISRFDMHSAFANSKALQMSGIESHESLFTNEEIIKDSGGITGELKERAMDFVMDQIPEVNLAERTSIAFEQMKKLHSLGITAISDITLKADLDVYKELISMNKLQLRVDARLPFTEFKNIDKYKTEFSKLSDNIKFNSLKAFYDGSLSSKTAYMHSNYKNESHSGIKTDYVNSGEFHKAAIEIDKAGFQLSVHAIGDKAVTELLDLNEELIGVNGKRDRRFRIEHAQHISEGDFSRFKEMNVIASVQPAHLFSDAKTAFEILPDHSTEHNYKRLIDIGARICFGTDFPVVGESPFETMYYAVTRKVKGFENGFVPENRISLDECIKAYTSENAYAVFEEDVRGKLKKEMKADIVVLDKDIFEMNPDELNDAKVFMTYFNGERVFKK